MTRVLIADDHDVVGSGLRRVVEAQPSWEVVAEAAAGKDAIEKAAATKPDVAVLDSMMPLVNGVEATRQIRARLPKTEVLIFAVHDDERHIAEVLEAGARGYVLKAMRIGRSRRSSGSVSRPSRTAEPQLCGGSICRLQQQWFSRQFATGSLSLGEIEAPCLFHQMIS